MVNQKGSYGKCVNYNIIDIYPEVNTWAHIIFVADQYERVMAAVSNFIDWPNRIIHAQHLHIARARTGITEQNWHLVYRSPDEESVLS